jgi:thiol:disulfide interchange protein DsbC
MMRIFSSLVLAAAIFSLPAFADEAQIRQAVEAKLGGVRVDGVQASPVAGVYEVRVQGREGVQIFYTDPTGSYIFDGNLIDVKSNRNLTEERLQKLTSIEFSSLPLDMAVKIQRGNGRRVLAMFSDPYCPYCRRLEKTLQQLDDVTIYVFMYPVIRPQNADQSRAVWCSKDRAKAWLELAASDQPKVPAAGPGCANPIDKLLELGRTLHVNGTPTLFFADGERAGGVMELAALRSKLDEVARQQKK